ncbi:hypothetical protein FACS189454_01520 [Planctomycetales bacterium]|nr:hypothetical protein FACS189454_01520 [Planctomycetales bacterium]
MKLNLLIKGTLSIAFSAVLCIPAFVFADEPMTDFERLLQSAIEDNKLLKTGKPAVAAVEKEKIKPKTESTKVPLTEPQNVTKDSPKTLVAQRPSDVPKKNNTIQDNSASRVAVSEVILDDGWVTVTPNDPNTAVPVTAPRPGRVAAKPEPAPEAAEENVVKELQPFEKPKILIQEEEEYIAVPKRQPALEKPKETRKENKEGHAISRKLDELAAFTDTESETDSDSKSEEPDSTPQTDTKKPVAQLPESESETEDDADEESVAKATETKPESKSSAKTNSDEKPETKKGDESTIAKEAEKVTSKITGKVASSARVPDFDEDDEKKYSVVDASLAGEPHSKDKIRLMYDEIISGFRARNVGSRYEMWKNYAKSTLKGTEGINTGSELDGRCRLSWYKKLYADPIQSVFEVEEFSRKLHNALSGNHRGLAEILPDIRSKMDVPERNDAGIRFTECKTPLDALEVIKSCLVNASSLHAQALAPLTQAELTELSKNLIPTFVGPTCINGHTIYARSVGRKHVDIMDGLDKAAMWSAAEALVPMTNPSLLALLDKLPENVLPTVMLNGVKVQRLSTPAGDIIIGGRENNVYDLDSPAMKDVICVIDLGGNDSYREGTCNLDRPVFAIIDLHGNDVYSGSKPGIQGGSILGVSLLLDAEGDDTYSAVDLAQGSTIGGAGILIDLAGNDKYKALRRVQGHALMGLGMLIDKKGADDYHAALWAQGFGAPGGFGLIEDTEGNDHYYCGGLYLDSYPEHPGYDGWGQGVGAGIRQVANGGIGVLLDGSGDDVYEVDYFGHGGGYWLGVGFARDFGGNDIRHGTTKTAYDGRPRQQQEWTRFANGFGCHYSLGYCFDDQGNDVYGGRIMGTGMAWDLSIGYLCDFNGSDKFTATGGMTQGIGAEGSIGILFSYGGNDEYLGRNQAFANGNITYHSPSNCGGNISFLINYGGQDKYGCGAKNNSYVQRGTASGFLIDRPTDKEAVGESAALKKLIEERNQEIADYDADVAIKKDEYAARGRRYVPRTRRPQPITLEQQQSIGAVPSFDNDIAAPASVEKDVKTDNAAAPLKPAPANGAAKADNVKTSRATTNIR